MYGAGARLTCHSIDPRVALRVTLCRFVLRYALVLMLVSARAFGRNSNDTTQLSLARVSYLRPLPLTRPWPLCCCCLRNHTGCCLVPAAISFRILARVIMLNGSSRCAKLSFCSCALATHRSACTTLLSLGPTTALLRAHDLNSAPSPYCKRILGTAREGTLQITHTLSQRSCELY